LPGYLKIKASDFSNCSATVVGYGHMGRHYVKALQALGVSQIRVCSRSEGPLSLLKGSAGVQTFSGGFQQFQPKPFSNELAIITTPTADLIPAALHLRELGFDKFLIEKPISLWSSKLAKFQETFMTKDDVDSHGQSPCHSAREVHHPMGGGQGGEQDLPPTLASVGFTPRERIDPEKFSTSLFTPKRDIFLCHSGRPFLAWVSSTRSGKL
jgi:hypothetical protein